MSLEERMAELTAALIANTTALGGAAASKAPRAAKAAAAPTPAPAAAPVVATAPAAVATPATARAPTADTAVAVTPAQIKAAGDDLSLLAEADRAQAVAILAEFGVQKMTAMPQGSIPEFHARVKAALAKGATPSLV